MCPAVPMTKEAAGGGGGGGGGQGGRGGGGGGGGGGGETKRVGRDWTRWSPERVDDGVQFVRQDGAEVEQKPAVLNPHDDGRTAFAQARRPGLRGAVAGLHQDRSRGQHRTRQGASTHLRVGGDTGGDGTVFQDVPELVRQPQRAVGQFVGVGGQHAQHGNLRPGLVRREGVAGGGGPGP